MSVGDKTLWGMAAGVLLVAGVVLMVWAGVRAVLHVLHVWRLPPRVYTRPQQRGEAISGIAIAEFSAWRDRHSGD